MPATIPPAERLLDLVIALVNTPTRMTKQQVRRTVAGYLDATSDEAFERMFERDKDTLRELGVPVRTVVSAGHGDDVGYRIDLEDYALAPFELTPAELGVLSLAAQLWQDQSLRTDSSRALTKLRAAAPGVSGAGQVGDLVAGLAPRVRTGGADLGTLVDAVHARRRVRFTYRAATTGEVRERSVEPWRVVARRGGWLLVGHDRDRKAVRSFRLSRIEGRVRAIGRIEAFTAPDEAVVDAALARWEDGPERTARLAVLPERAGALRARATFVGPGPGGRDLLDVSFRSTGELVDEVLGYGDAVLVLDPPDVRESVLRRLRVAARLGEEPRG